MTSPTGATDVPPPRWRVIDELAASAQHALHAAGNTLGSAGSSGARLEGSGHCLYDVVVTALPALAGRLGILGDVHCEDVALAAARALFAAAGTSYVLAVGDLVDGPGDPHRTLELLADVDAVAGNHERWYRHGTLRTLPDALPVGTLGAAHARWVAALPATRTYATPHGELLLCHGIDDDDMATLRPDDLDYAIESNTALQRLLDRGAYRFVVSGHSHRRMIRKLATTTFINAGTLLRGFEPCVLVLDLDDLTATFFDWDGTAFTPCATITVP
jgi:predicted phosphodiesterase